MPIGLIVLAAAAVSPVSADFDGDGLADRAYLREASSGYEIVIDRGAGGSAVVESVVDPANLTLGVLEAGTYETACGKRLGRDSDPCPDRPVRLARPALAFGTAEASQAVAIWDGLRFRVEWLSD